MKERRCRLRARIGIKAKKLVAKQKNDGIAA